MFESSTLVDGPEVIENKACTCVGNLNVFKYYLVTVDAVHLGDFSSVGQYRC